MSAGFAYDASGNVTSDGGQTFSYDATSQEVTASIYNSQFSYDGNGLREKKIENGVTTITCGRACWEAKW